MYRGNSGNPNFPRAETVITIAADAKHLGARVGLVIRHYGLLTNRQRADNLDLARALLAMPPDEKQNVEVAPEESVDETCLAYPCSACGGAMVIIERFDPNKAAYAQPRASTAAETKAACNSTG